MKKYFQLLHTLLLCSAILLHGMLSFAQTQALPEMKLPAIDYKPTIKKGWAGQYVYQINFDDTSTAKNDPYKTYYSVKANCTYSGYIEFPTEVRGAIRVNQPDKYNATRWESWIRSGTSSSFSNVDVLVKSLEPHAATPVSGITGTIEKTMTLSSGSEWIKGWMFNCDMQIDHTEGKYSFAVPYVNYDLKGGKEQYIITTFRPAKKDTVIKEMNTRHDFRDYKYVNTGGDWEFVTGNFKQGQTEIVIRERIPFVLQQAVTRNGKDIKLSAAKGFMDFYLVLKKVG